MAQYNTLNVKLSILQLNKLKTGTEITLKLSSNVCSYSNEEINFSN